MVLFDVKRSDMRRSIVILNVIVCLKVSVSVAFHVDLVLSMLVAGEGETLSAVCEVSTNVTAQNYQIVWFKILPDITDDEVEIATNNYVNREFKETNRYEAWLNLTRPGDYTHVRFSLRISNLQSRDSGYLGCRIGMPMVNIERFRLFTVQVRLVDIDAPDSFFSIPISFQPGENASWSEGQSVQLTCHCIGAYPRPDVEVLIGNEALTHRFTRADELIRGMGPTGLQPMHYSVELTHRGIVAEYRFDAKELKCRARLPGFDADMSAVLYVHIAEYRPKFFCTRQMTTKLGQENFNMTCRVKAEPEVKNTTVFRFDRYPFDNRSIPLNETGLFQLHTETLGEKEMLLMLKIDKVSTEHLGSYVFEAANELGSERHKLELHTELSAELHSMFIGSTATTKIPPRTSIFLLLLFLLLPLIRADDSSR